MKILVVRNDKLGDFTLALPAFAMLKKSFPTSEVIALVPNYTAPIAAHVKYIDGLLLDNEESATALANKLQGFDAIICLYSSKRVAMAAWLAKVPYRLAPATKWWQFFYNHRLVQRRSQSKKPEYQYNIDLVKQFLIDHKRKIQIPEAPYILGATPEPYQVVLHPGSGGSANNLSLEQYASLAILLSQKDPALEFLITAGPEEEASAYILEERLTSQGVKAKVVLSTAGLLGLVDILASASLFIGGSTGPLHLAGALNIKTVGFYPNKRSATALRWQTLNKVDKRLAFSPQDGSDDMTMVSIKDAAVKIYSDFLSG